MSSSRRGAAEGRPVILQVLPALVSGGAERAAVDVAQAIVDAGAEAIVASAGGPMTVELRRTGARHVTLPLDSKNPVTICRNADAAGPAHRGRGRRYRPCPQPGPGLERTIGRHGAPARHFLTSFHGVYDLGGWVKRRYNSVMVRGERVIAVSDYVARPYPRELPGRPGAYPHHPPRHRPLPLRSGAGHARARHPARPAVAAGRRGAGGHAGRAPLALEGPDGVPGGAGAARRLRLRSALPHRRLRSRVAAATGRSWSGPHGASGVDGIVQFTGDCRDMPAAFMLADVVVSASTEPEAFGRVIAEAQAMGRVVIATDHGGAREQVLPERTGWLVKPGDPEALAAALAEALALAPGERLAIGRVAAEHVRATFTKETMCDARSASTRSCWRADA